MKTVQLEITQDDINHGEHCNGYACPAARAFMRATEMEQGSFRFSFAWVEIGKHKKARLPDELAHWIAEFDLRNPVQPVTFAIEIP